MTREEVAAEIYDPNFDLEFYVNLCLKDKQVRNIMLELLIDEDINLYYHSYYILQEATIRKPELFYDFIGLFFEMLKFDISYHRNIGHELIANIINPDKKQVFDKQSVQYFEVMNDPKYLTGLLAIRNSIVVARIYPEYIDIITEEIFDFLDNPHYKKNQIELAKYDMICFFEEFMSLSKYQEKMKELIVEWQNSSSPKSRKKAKEVTKKLK